MLALILVPALVLAVSATDDPKEIRKICVDSLKHTQVGTAAEELQNGVDLYKHMFVDYPHYRKYFKGKEAYEGDDVQKDDFFKKQGQRILVAVHVLCSTFDVDPTFKAYTREVLNLHKRENIMLEARGWDEFWTIFEEYLGTRMTLDDATKHAWKEVGKKFDAEAKLHAEQIGMPH